MKKDDINRAIAMSNIEGALLDPETDISTGGLVIRTDGSKQLLTPEAQRLIDEDSKCEGGLKECRECATLEQCERGARVVKAKRSEPKPKPPQPTPEQAIADVLKRLDFTTPDFSTLARERRAYYTEAQRNFIAAYTGREPGEIPDEDTADAQQFWNTHPQAIADVLANEMTADIKGKVREWLKTDSTIVKYMDFYGVDLAKAYKALAPEERETVDRALQRENLEYSRAYVKAALLPKFELSIMPLISEGQKQTFSRAIRNNTTPGDKEEAALLRLYVMLYDMADDSTRDKAAEAIGVERDDLEQYALIQGRVDSVAFPQGTAEEQTPKAEAEKDELPTVKSKLPQLPPQSYGTGFYPLTLAYLNTCLLGIPLDGQWHARGNGDYKFKVRFTVERNCGVIPFPLDDFAEKISTIIGVGREMEAEYFDVNAIARYILYGDPDAHEPEPTIIKTGENAGKKIRKLAYVSKDIADTIDTMIDFMTGIKADVEYAIWQRDKNGKKQLMRVMVSRYLLNGGVRVEISNYGHTTRTYGRGDKKRVDNTLRVWGFPSIREDSELKSYAPVLYDIASKLGEVAQIPMKEADIRHYLPEGARITPDDVRMRDATLREYFRAQRNEGRGVLRLSTIETDTGINSSKWRSVTSRSRKQRCKRLASIVDTLTADGKLRSATPQKGGEEYDIVTEEYRPRRGGSKRKKTPDSKGK